MQAALLSLFLISVGFPNSNLGSAQSRSAPSSGLSLAVSGNASSVSSFTPINAVATAAVSYSHYPPAFCGLAKEQQLLIKYYDMAVCPALVVFDSPTNPFRKHIVEMAFSNGALLEALFALALCHMHSRKRMGLALPSHLESIFTHSGSSPEPVLDAPGSSHGEQTTSNIPYISNGTALKNGNPITSAALYHKNKSTQLLQEQLTDSALCNSDSALATLLVLLMYHMCETGVGNFKVHLAGVKKLMMMRKVGRETGRWGWMETVFTFCDNMCASINDREAQLRGGYLDMILESADEWGLENITGCDRDLFMRLAGLGRINVLSQSAATSLPAAVLEDDDGAKEPERNEDDGRTGFWLAWNAMRRDLIDWRPTTRFEARLLGSRSAQSSKNAALVAVERNYWLHAQNVWRAAAILYLNRLAYPQLDSSHSIFQNTVREALDHVACVPVTGIGNRLSWPLFVTGSECVIDIHQSLIRHRYIEIQKESGFYNKFSGLAVLESLWRDQVRAEPLGNSTERKQNQSVGGRGLRWRNITEPGDAEYLMV